MPSTCQREQIFLRLLIFLNKQKCMLKTNKIFYFMTDPIIQLKPTYNIIRIPKYKSNIISMPLPISKKSFTCKQNYHSIKDATSQYNADDFVEICKTNVTMYKCHLSDNYLENSTIMHASAEVYNELVSLFSETKLQTFIKPFLS